MVKIKTLRSKIL